MVRIESQELFEVIDIIDALHATRYAQERRGLNDLNIFTTLLSMSDEVRLHSRFISYLLNPNQSHGQGSLFLELFLKICGIELDIDTENTSSVTEFNHIDIYLTDNFRHLIIENKIFAQDQDRQIELVSP